MWTLELIIYVIHFANHKICKISKLNYSGIDGARVRGGDWEEMRRDVELNEWSGWCKIAQYEEYAEPVKGIILIIFPKNMLVLDLIALYD